MHFSNFSYLYLKISLYLLKRFTLPVSRRTRVPTATFFTNSSLCCASHSSITRRVNSMHVCTSSSLAHARARSLAVIFLFLSCLTRLRVYICHDVVIIPLAFRFALSFAEHFSLSFVRNSLLLCRPYDRSGSISKLVISTASNVCLRSGPILSCSLLGPPPPAVLPPVILSRSLPVAVVCCACRRVGAHGMLVGL